MKKCFKLLFLSVLIFSLTSNVFAATAQTSDKNFYLMSESNYIKRGLREQDLDETDLAIKDKVESYSKTFTDVSKAQLKSYFENEDQESLDKVIRFLGIDFNQNAINRAKELESLGCDINEIKKELKSDGFTSIEINNAIGNSTIVSETKTESVSLEDISDPSLTKPKVKEAIELIQAINLLIPLSRRVTKNALKSLYSSNEIDRALDQCNVDWQKNCNYYYGLLANKAIAVIGSDINKQITYISKQLTYLGFTSDNIFKAQADTTTGFIINPSDYENLTDSEMIAKLKMNGVPDTQIQQCILFIKGSSQALYEANLKVED